MNILIYGLGLSGKSALKYSLSRGFNTYVLNQGEVSSWFTQDLGIDKSKCFQEGEKLDFKIDKVILSPGIPRAKDTVQFFINNNIDVICDVEFFFENLNCKIIAVTGTNGKTTTSDMIHKYLIQNKISAFLGGNIGIPVCDYKDEEYAVLELSSYQLESIKNFRSDVCVFTNIFPNHLDRYNGSFDEYKEAKLNLLKNLTGQDKVIYHESFDLYSRLKNQYYVCVNKVKLKSFSQSLDFSQAKVRGEHNKENFLMAYLALKNSGIKIAKKSFQDFVNNYAGVEHRLEYIGDFSGLTAYNDSKSTNITATETALSAFDSNVHLVLGGLNKNISIIEKLKSFKNIQKIYLVGESKEFLANDLKQLSPALCDSFDDLLDKVKSEKGILLFSPAHQSFDQFDNFMKRGEFFKKLVLKKFS